MSSKPSATRPLDQKNERCPCGASFPVHPPGYCGGTGYAITLEGERICYPCADKREIESLKDRSKPFTGYISSDGRHLTTWTGGKLGTVVVANREVRTRRVSNAYWSGTHREPVYSYQIEDVHGKRWHGKGSPGMLINLRPAK